MNPLRRLWRVVFGDDAPSSPDRMIGIVNAPNLPLAEMYQGMLASAGIPSDLVGGRANRSLGVALRVRAGDADEALAILRERADP